MSLLDELEVSDLLKSAEEVSKISSENQDDSSTPYMLWYDNVNNTPEYTHLLVICLDGSYWDSEKAGIPELISIINYAADAYFISHSEPNIVILNNPTNSMFITYSFEHTEFIQEPSYKNGGPVLKSEYKNGRLRIKLAVEFPEHYATTKYLNFLVSVRTFLDNTLLVPRNGEFIEVYCREKNNVWRTLTSQAIEEQSVYMGMAPIFGEGDLAYFYKFLDNKKNVVVIEKSVGSFNISNSESELPQQLQGEIWRNSFLHRLLRKMIDCGPSVSRQVDAWIKRADRFYGKCQHDDTGIDIEDLKPKQTITINGQKYIFKNQSALKEKLSAGTDMRIMLMWTSIAACAVFIFIMTIYHLLLR